MSAQYNMRLGLGYLASGDMSIAKTKLYKAFKQQPRAANINAALAYFMEKSGDIANADKFYRRALDYSSNRGLDFNNYAVFLCSQKNYQKANRYFMLAVNDVHYAHTAKAYADAGVCYLSVNQEKQAAVFFEQALIKDPKQKDSLRALVKIFMRNNNLRRVCELLKIYAITAKNDVNLANIAVKYCKVKLVN